MKKARAPASARGRRRRRIFVPSAQVPLPFDDVEAPSPARGNRTGEGAASALAYLQDMERLREMERQGMLLG